MFISFIYLFFQQKISDPGRLGRYCPTNSPYCLVSSADVPFLAGGKQTETHRSQVPSDWVCCFTLAFPLHFTLMSSLPHFLCLYSISEVWLW